MSVYLEYFLFWPENTLLPEVSSSFLILNIKDLGFSKKISIDRLYLVCQCQVHGVSFHFLHQTRSYHFKLIQIHMKAEFKLGCIWTLICLYFLISGNISQHLSGIVSCKFFDKCNIIITFIPVIKSMSIFFYISYMIMVLHNFLFFTAFYLFAISLKHYPAIQLLKLTR